jgi:hypothetical protein
LSAHFFNGCRLAKSAVEVFNDDELQVWKWPTFENGTLRRDGVGTPSFQASLCKSNNFFKSEVEVLSKDVA